MRVCECTREKRAHCQGCINEGWESDDAIRREIKRLFREQDKKRRCRG